MQEPLFQVESGREQCAGQEDSGIQQKKGEQHERQSKPFVGRRQRFQVSSQAHCQENFLAEQRAKWLPFDDQNYITWVHFRGLPRFWEKLFYNVE